MRQRTRLQKVVAALSEKLPPLTESQELWIKRNAIPAVAYRSKKNMWCTACGNWFSNEDEHKRCPYCGAKFQSIEDSPRTSKRKDSYYTTIHTTCKGFQVARHFLVKRLSRKYRDPEWEIAEVVQIWINEKGEEAIMARNVYCPSYYNDLWNLTMPMSIKERRWQYYSYRGDRYNISSHSNRICRMLPIIKRNGFDGNFHDICPTDLFKLLLKNPQAENLYKTKQFELLRYIDKGKEIKHPHAVNICNRNGYYVQDASLWCDYLDLLDYFGLDTHNAHYVCPVDLNREHDILMQRKNAKEAQKKLEEQLKEAKKYEKKYAKEKGKYFGIVFGDDYITIAVLQSVQEIAQEGTIMHHCVYANGYYKKPESLILSAQDKDGNRIETIEINLRTFKVVQSRGVCNKMTDQHERILQLCNANMHKIKAVS